MHPLNIPFALDTLPTTHTKKPPCPQFPRLCCYRLSRRSLGQSRITHTDTHTHTHSLSGNPSLSLSPCLYKCNWTNPFVSKHSNTNEQPHLCQPNVYTLPGNPTQHPSSIELILNKHKTDVDVLFQIYYLRYENIYLSICLYACACLGLLCVCVWTHI